MRIFINEIKKMNTSVSKCKYLVINKSHLADHLVDPLAVQEVGGGHAVQGGGAHRVVAVADVARQLAQRRAARAPRPRARHHPRPVRLQQVVDAL